LEVIHNVWRALNIAKIDIEEGRLKSLPVVKELFGKTTGSSILPSMPTVYSLPAWRLSSAKAGRNLSPLPAVTGCYRVIACSRPFEPFPQLLSGFHIPFSPHGGRNPAS
jgi:hypothetical protein